MRRFPGILLSTALLVIGTTQGTPAQTDKVWNLGLYSGGSYAQMDDVNDAGVVVGVGGIGDVGNGDRIHPLMTPLFGPDAGKWTDLGTLGGEVYGYDWLFPRISNTGVVVMMSTIADGSRHAAVWTKQTGLTDLGTLYGYCSSGARGINKFGTLIVGWSSSEGACSYQVATVWTPSVVCKDGRWSVNWTVHKLDTAGLDGFPNTVATGVNDFGQIIGTASDSDFSANVGVVWNLFTHGMLWKVTQLPSTTTYPYAQLNDINDKGEITGLVSPPDNSVLVPAYWKPRTATRFTYSQPFVLPFHEGLAGGCWVYGINNLGDVTGQCWGTLSSTLGVRWKVSDPTFSEIVAPLGNWSFLG